MVLGVFYINKETVKSEQFVLICLEDDGVHSEAGETTSSSVSKKCGVLYMYNSLPKRSRAIDRTRSQTSTLLILASQLCCFELLFVCVGSCIYIRGLCQPLNNSPPISQ
ncbi:hypothetical protein GOODEAATRI_021466 [Goodea atripinnis]|uniref:Uncharacterized protein n=1 Tax=Goodea atripinnis TaxID=208336 RepID=A0ABV0NDH9_9TELE